jgi:uncharacterized protein
MRIDLGRDRERRYLEKLSSDGRFVEIIPDVPHVDAAHLTREAMRAGVPVIHRGVLEGPGWFDRTDFLVRVPTPSALGDHSYEVVDMKLSRESNGRAVDQLCFYSKLLEEEQGRLPDSFVIVLGDGSEQRFSTRAFLSYSRCVGATQELESP